VDQFTGWAERTGDWFRRNVPGVRQLNDLGAAAGDFAGHWGMRAAQATGADQWKVPERVLDAADAVTRPVLQNEFLMNRVVEQERFSYGVAKGAVDTVEGVHTLATRPGEVVQGLGQAIRHPIQTGQQIGQAIGDAYRQDPNEFMGRAVFEVGSSLIPGGAATKAGKAGQVADKLGDVGRVASHLDDAARVGAHLDDAARVGSRVDDVARAGSTLRRGTAEFDDLARQTAAKEELAQRLRGTLEGRHEVPPGARGHAMSGARGDMTPEQIRAQINRLEQEASVNRSRMAMAEPPVRPSVGELIDSSTRTAAGMTDEAFTRRAFGYPEDLSQKFSNGEVESMRVYLGNEVRGDPVNPAARFPQSDLHDGLDELARGFTDVNGNAVPPGDLTRINFQHINGQLRGSRKDLTPGQVDRVQELVKHMDSAMEKSRLQEPTTVYRVNKVDYTRPDASGLIRPDPGFQSTGRTPQTGFATSNPKDYVVQIIELEPGQKAFDMDALTRFYGDIGSFRDRMPPGVPNKSPFGEQEVLLPRGTQLRVLDEWHDAATGFTVQRVKVAK
jgi:hypothetical protein